jgi:hypothetical protein
VDVSATKEFTDYGADLRAGSSHVLPAPDETDARRALRGQISHLERELSAILAEGFPHLSTDIYGPQRRVVSSLLSLGELELMRDRLAGRAQEARGLIAARVAFEQRSRALLEDMKLRPGHHRFTRVSTRDLGEGTCGEWEVRPRLGLIGMLAGWWHVKLSSGCPLPRGCTLGCSPVDSELAVGIGTVSRLVQVRR